MPFSVHMLAKFSLNQTTYVVTLSIKSHINSE